MEDECAKYKKECNHYKGECHIL
jgi:predicted  nucleic acid-binding Zn-ribbon protein